MAASIYLKLQAVRDAIAAAEIQKGGKNENSDFRYFDSADFMPKTREILKDNKLFHHLSFDKDLATLTFVDLEGGDCLRFTSPMSTANVRGLHPVQNLGWAQTYLGRRLMIVALDLSEPDQLEATAGERTITRPGGLDRFPQGEPGQEQDPAPEQPAAPAKIEDRF